MTLSGKLPALLSQREWKERTWEERQQMRRAGKKRQREREMRGLEMEERQNKNRHKRINTAPSLPFPLFVYSLSLNARSLWYCSSVLKFMFTWMFSFFRTLILPKQEQCICSIGYHSWTIDDERPIILSPTCCSGRNCVSDSVRGQRESTKHLSLMYT